MQATRSRAEAVAQQDRRRRARRAATRPLASETTAARGGSPASGSAGDDLVEPARGDAEEDELGARQAGADGLDAQLRAAARRPAGRPGSRGRRRAARPARGCAPAASCAAAARQQHGDRGAERPGADDHGAPRAGRGQRERRPRTVGHGRSRVVFSPRRYRLKAVHRGLDGRCTGIYGATPRQGGSSAHALRWAWSGARIIRTQHRGARRPCAAALAGHDERALLIVVRDLRATTCAALAAGIARRGARRCPVVGATTAAELTPRAGADLGRRGAGARRRRLHRLDRPRSRRRRRRCATRAPRRRPALGDVADRAPRVLLLLTDGLAGDPARDRPRRLLGRRRRRPAGRRLAGRPGACAASSSFDGRRSCRTRSSASRSAPTRRSASACATAGGGRRADARDRASRRPRAARSTAARRSTSTSSASGAGRRRADATAFDDFATHPLGMRRRAGEEHVRWVGDDDVDDALAAARPCPQGALVWLMEGDARRRARRDRRRVRRGARRAGRPRAAWRCWPSTATRAAGSSATTAPARGRADRRARGRRAGRRLLHVRRDRPDARHRRVPPADPRRPGAAHDRRRRSWSPAAARRVRRRGVAACTDERRGRARRRRARRRGAGGRVRRARRARPRRRLGRLAALRRAGAATGRGRAARGEGVCRCRAPARAGGRRAAERRRHAPRLVWPARRRLHRRGAHAAARDGARPGADDAAAARRSPASARCARAPTARPPRTRGCWTTLRERQRVLEAMARIQRAISRRAPLQGVLDTIVGAAGELLGDDAPALLLCDEEDPGWLVVAASRGVRRRHGSIAAWRRRSASAWPAARSPKGG